ncbi:MAG TPA: DNA/RNA non-specific endonuclease [Solirubrobacteraceae bacterium]|nr:DNA/RNA non-specific endonuclease [Solirubrobacteraceae bacterium]
MTVPAAEAAAAEPAAAPVAVREPEDEPGFQAMMQRTQRVAATTKAHQPAAEGAATALGAALAPDNDLSSQAAAAQVEVMGEQEPGVFDARAFVAAVKRAVEAATPATLEDADEFKQSGAVGTATAQIGALVQAGKESSEHDIQAATEAAPDLSKAEPKPVAEMVDDETGPAPATVGAAGAQPGPHPAEQTDLSAGPARIDGELAAANITEEQIARSNEPDFSAALDARQRARDHAATAPGQYRLQEEAILAQGREGAAADAAAQLQGMHGERAGALGRVLGDKQDAKRAHEAEHARVAGEIEAIYEAAKADVGAILDELDATVDEQFARGEEVARTRFEDYVDDRMRAYKRARYDRLGGGLLWAKDKLFGMPDEVNEFYEQGRADYLAAMDAVIEGIASTVGSELTAARARIVEGRAEVRAYVEALPEDLRAVGEQAQGRLEDRFDELSSEVDAKQDALVDAVARRYVESRDALDARIEELQAANRGLVDRALDAVVGVIKTIIALGEMLLRVLARAAEVVGDIIADPIGFLSNLVDGVMGGLKRFVSRIATHLSNALVDWLFGTLAGAGIRLPPRLDGAGALDLVTQVIGLTYANVRARVARIVGEPVVARMEQTVELFKTLASAGLGGLWELVSGKLADLKDTVLGKLEEWIVERVIKGGIAWIIGLLNPVAAFIKACKAIYEIVMFIVDRAKQVMAFVDAILDSVGAIAKGNLGAAEEKVEGALAKALPLAIGFLASLLGLGGISEKVKSIVAVVRRPVERAIDSVVIGVARAFQRTFGGMAALARDKVEAGRAWANAKVQAGRDWVRAKVEHAPASDVAAGAPDAAGDRAASADAGERLSLRFGRESHEVRGEIADGRPQVLMASFEPDFIPMRIGEIRGWYVTPFVAAGGPLQARAMAIEADLGAIETFTDVRLAAIARADADRQVPELHELLVTLRNRLESLATTHGLPGTGWVMAQHSAAPKGTISHRRQTGVRAQLCIASWRHGAAAAGNPPGRRTAGFDGRRYERGHLLARALGGTGGDDNLAMISDAANREMRDYGERTARENLDARPATSGPHYSPENVIGYDVTVVYDESKDLEKYLRELGLNASAAFTDLFDHAEHNRPVDQATISSLLGRSLTRREYGRVCELWRERFLAHHLEIRMQVLQGRAVVGGFYGPIAAHR